MNHLRSHVSQAFMPIMKFRKEFTVEILSS